MSGFKYLGFALDESGTDGAEYGRNMASGRIIARAIKSLVNASDLQLECPRVFHEKLLVAVLMYGSETMLGKRRRDPELWLYRWTTSEDF